MSHKDITVTSNARGFHIYGEPVNTTYGHDVEVYESSSAKSPHVWLRITKGPEVPKDNLLGYGPEQDVCAHLTVQQAKAVRDRLNAFIKEVPQRWGKHW